MIKYNILLQSGDKIKIQVKNKNIKITDLINTIYNNHLKEKYKIKNNYNFVLVHKGIVLCNKLSDYNIPDNSDINFNVKSKSKSIQQKKSIIDEYVISPFSSSFSNSFEKEIDKIDIGYILNKIEKIENELNEIKDYINN